MVIYLSNLLVKVFPMLSRQIGPILFSCAEMLSVSNCFTTLACVVFLFSSNSCFLLQDHFSPPPSPFWPVHCDGTRAKPMKLGKANHKFRSSGPNNWLTDGQVTYSQQEAQWDLYREFWERFLLPPAGWGIEGCEPGIPSLSLRKEPLCRSRAKKDWQRHWSHLFLLTVHLSDTNFFTC